MAELSEIQKVEVDELNLPLQVPFRTARHVVMAARCVRVTIQLDNGLVGVGAGTPNEVVTGDTMASLMAVLKELAPTLVGYDIGDWNQLLTRVQHLIVGNGPAKAALELALYDLRAQSFGVTLPELLGSRTASVTTDMTISIHPLEQMVAEAKQVAARGFKAVKIKVGSGDLDDDLARVNAIAKALGPGHRLRLDANQAWTTSDAANALRALASQHLPIDFVEQPVPAGDIAGMRALTQMHLLPIMADEAVFSFADALTILDQRAADYINIKLMKTGGLSEATKINAACAARGVACMVGCMIEPNTSLRAAVAFAAAHANVRFVDLDAAYMVREPQPGLDVVGATLTFA